MWFQAVVTRNVFIKLHWKPRVVMMRILSLKPANTRRNDNVIIASKRRHFDVIMTLILRHTSAGKVWYHQWLQTCDHDNSRSLWNANDHGISRVLCIFKYEVCHCRQHIVCWSLRLYHRPWFAIPRCVIWSPSYRFSNLPVVMPRSFWFNPYNAFHLSDHILLDNLVYLSLD